MSQTGKAVEYLCLACGSQGLTVPNQTCEADQPQTPVAQGVERASRPFGFTGRPNWPWARRRERKTVKSRIIEEAAEGRLLFLWAR